MAHSPFWVVKVTSWCDLYLHFYTWVFYNLVVACDAKRKNFGIFVIFWYQVFRAISSGIRGCDERKQNLNVLVSTIFHIRVKYTFQVSYCTFSKCNLGLAHCGLKLYFLGNSKFFKNSPAKSIPLSTQIFLERFVFVFMVENAFTVSLESFFFIPSASIVLSSKSWLTSKYFTPFFLFY